jgi:quercetin dioxygenase-like cupin family protein
MTSEGEQIMKNLTIPKCLKTKVGPMALLGALSLFAAAAYAATTVILAVGTIPESKFFNGPATVTVRTLTIAPGEILQWHYHPGYAFNVVKSGVLTVEDGCGGEEESLTPGQAFEEVDGRVHRAKNIGTEVVVVYNTFVVPEGNPTTNNIPNNERRCGPPENFDECSHDGWMIFNHPQTFKNQGECFRFVLFRPRTLVTVP